MGLLHQLVMLFVQWSCEYLAAPGSGCSPEMDSGEHNHGFQGLSCSMDITRSRHRQTSWTWIFGSWWVRVKKSFSGCPRFCMESLEVPKSTVSPFKTDKSPRIRVCLAQAYTFSTYWQIDRLSINYSQCLGSDLSSQEKYTLVFAFECMSCFFGLRRSEGLRVRVWTHKLDAVFQQFENWEIFSSQI